MLTVAREFVTAHTAADFERWVARSEPGQVCEYHRGRSLYLEDEHGNLVSPPRRVETADIAWALGPAILKAIEHGRGQALEFGLGVVDLAQRKVRPGVYSYLLAIRRDAKRKRRP